MIVRFTGPTGTDSSKPLMKPVSPASRIVSAMRTLFHGNLLRLLILFFFDLAANPAGNARSDKTVHQVKREQGWQYVIKNLFPQDHDEPEEQGGDNRFGKSAAGTQAERFETGISYLADHHGRKEQQDGDEQPLPFAQTALMFI